MFYGIPPGREKEMQQALATIADIYDMLITLARNLSFRRACNVNQMSAELAFMSERGQHILELPTGQGVVIKQA